MSKPRPRPITIVCSECGLDWETHGESPTKDDCIRLLKAELAKKPSYVPYPYPVYPRPYNPYPVWYGSGTWTSTSPSSGAVTSYQSTVVYRSPDDGEPPAGVPAA